MSDFPYAGLRPFQSDEAAIFFGREQHTDELLARLSKQQFLAVVGYSGSGKSSLVKAGLVPSLQAGFLGKAGTYWQIAQMHPGNEPFTNLAEALIDEKALGESYRIALLQNEFLKHGAFSLHEFLAIKPLAHNGKLLIVCDQFEEIFRYQNAEANSEAAAFVELLLASAKPYTLPNGEISNSIYVVLTMRSDFIGDCALFSGLAEAINNGLYLTPRLTREQLRAAIEEPALVFNGKVEPDLVVKLLQDAENNSDQLPLLQHALMRLWNNSTDKILTMNDYSSKLGNLKQALSDHADKIFNELTDKQQKITEILFKSLTERGNDQRDTRRSVELSKVEKLANVEWREIATIVDAFRKEGRSFLLPALPKKLSSDSMLDISHESLIRQWQKLKDWTEQEANAADIYQRLEEAAVSWKERRHSYYRTPELENALDWYKKQQNRAIWASRYGQNFELAEKFLLESEEYEDKSEDVIYCNNYIKRFGAIYPYGELTEKQVKHHSLSIKLIRKGKRNPFYKMQIVNGLGVITPNHDIDIGTYLNPADFNTLNNLIKVCQWEFVYDADDDVIYEKAYNKEGKLVSGFVYLPRTKNDLSAKAFFIGADGYPEAQSNSKAEYVEFTYSEQGDEIEVHYFDRHHNPQAGFDKTYGRKQEFDEKGLVTKKTTIDAQGMPMNGVDGYASLVVQYDSLGNQAELTYFDLEEQPALVKDGYHKVSAEYDEQGNQINLLLFDTEGQAVLHKKGFHKYTCRYDNAGNQIEWAYFDVLGQPTLHKEGNHKLTAKYDDRGNQIEWAYFDVAGQPTSYKDGFHKFTAKYDDRGNQIEWAYFDVAGQPTAYKDGFHKLTAKYDDRDNQIEWVYFDVAGQPTLRKDGNHKFTAKYDDRGNQIEGDYFDVEGQPTLHKDGYHKFSTKYDDRDNQIEWVYFDVDGQPTLHKEGNHKFSAKYDDRGNQIEWAYFDVAGQPTLRKDGNHKFTAKYDGRGNRIEGAYFDVAGQPTLHKNGYHKFSAKYDDRGNQIEEAYFDEAGQPTIHKDGNHKFTAKYDDRGNQIEWAYFDEAGQPTLHEDGIYKLTAKYDDRDNQIEWAYFDEAGQPTLYKNGYHKVSAKYDGRGNQIEGAYFDVEGRPALHKNGYHKFSAKYDDRGNQTEWAYFDEAGQPTLHEEGFHKLTAKYDGRGNQTEWAYFDVAGQPTLDNYGDHKITAKYDGRGNQIEWAYFDVAGQPNFH